MSTGPRGEKLIQGMYAFAFSPDGTKIATASPDHNILICDVNTGTCLHTFTGHTDIINTMDWHGDKIISGSEAGEVVLWDLSGLDLNTEDKDRDVEVSTLKTTFLRRGDDPIKRVAFSEDGLKLMSLTIADRDASDLTIWSTANSEQLQIIFGQNGARMRDACFSPDGAYIAIAAADALKIVLIRGDMIYQHPVVAQFSGDHHHVDWKKNHIATSTAHSRGASYLGTHVQVFGIIGNITDGNFTKRIEYSQIGWTSDLELSTDSMHIAFTGVDSRMVYQLDVSTHNRVRDMSHDERVSTVKYSPDGLVICCAAADGYLHLWDTIMGYHLKRRQIFKSAIDEYVEEYEDEDRVRVRQMMTPESADFIQIEKARLEINSLREKLNGYFLPAEINRYAAEFRLPPGVAEGLMQNEQAEPSFNDGEESAGGRKSTAGGDRRKFKRRRRKLRDSIKLRF